MRRRVVLALSVCVLTVALGVPVASADDPVVPLPLGTMQRKPTRPVKRCSVDAVCESFRVDCPGLLQPIFGTLGVHEPTAPARGLVVLFSGANGQGWFTQNNHYLNVMIQELQAAGLEAVEIRWETPWLGSSPGEVAGLAKLACRPSTVVQYLHDNDYAALGVTPSGPGSCGFCVAGESGGGSQVAFALDHYGLGSIVDVAVPISGPPLASIDKGCLDRPGEEAYWYGPNGVNHVDRGYGFTSPGTGPCATHDPSYEAQFMADSNSVGGDYFYPTTRVHVILGKKDLSVAPIQVHDWFDELVAAGSPMITLEEIPGMDHTLKSSNLAVAEFKATLLQ